MYNAYLFSRLCSDTKTEKAKELIEEIKNLEVDEKI